MDEVDVSTVLDNTIAIYQDELQKALRRKQRAEASLLKANRDIDLITGSLMGVQTIARQLAESGKQEKSPGPQGPRPSEEEVFQSKAITLAG